MLECYFRLQNHWNIDVKTETKHSCTSSPVAPSPPSVMLAVLCSFIVFELLSVPLREAFAGFFAWWLKLYFNVALHSNGRYKGYTVFMNEMRTTSLRSCL